ncbi:MAG: hypothetical protein ABSE51_00495 [Terracidiphilus sp.]|jgi:hypothetical protein
MTGPRSWNRREFDVTPAGFFTVLRPTGWFSATSRLPAGFRYLVSASKHAAAPHVVDMPAAAPARAPEQEALDRPAIKETTISLQILTLSAHDHHLMRQALILLSAAAITCFLLWWIFFRPHPFW